MGMAIPTMSLVFALSGLPGGANLLVNSGFEEGWQGWTTNHPWYEAGGPGKGNGVSTWTLDEKIVRSGNRSARVEGKNNRGIAMQVVTRYPDRYRVSGWIRTAGLDTGEAQILVEYKSRRGEYLGGTPVGSVRGTKDWTYVAAEIEAPSGTRTISVDLLTTAPNTGLAWFDDIALEDLTADTTPPGPVRFEPAPAAAGEIALRWTPEGKEPDVARYEVYVSEQPFHTLKGLLPKASVDADATGISVSGLEHNRKYYVRVVAVDYDQNRLDEGAPVMVLTKDTRAPRAVALEVSPVVSREGSVWMRWRPHRLDRDVARNFVTGAGRRRELRSPKNPQHFSGVGTPVAEVSVAARDEAGNIGPASTARVELVRAAVGRAFGLSGRVVAAGKPIAGAEVVAVDTRGRVFTTKTDAGGRYVLAAPAARAGTLFSVRASAEGYHASGSVWVLLRQGDCLALDFSLEVPVARLAAWTVSSLANVFPDALLPARPERAVDWLAARGETEGAQVVLRSDRAFSICGVECDPFAREGRAPGSQPAPTVRAAVVGTLRVHKNSTHTPQEQLLRKAPADFPDPFLEGWPQKVAAEVSRPVYLMVDVPRAAAPGRYRGAARIRVALEDHTRCEVVVPLALEVSSVALPERPTLPVTHWFNPQQFAAWHGVEMWTEDFWDILRVYARDMAEHRQTVVMVPLSTISAVRTGNGTVVYDFSRFDRWIQLFTQEGVGQRIEIMHFGGREHGQWEDKTFVLYPRTAYDVQTGQLVAIRPADFAAAVEEHLREKGWLERSVLHIADEPIALNVASWREISREIRTGAKRIKRIDAIHVPPEEVQGDLEVLVPQLNYFDQWRDRFLDAQKAGAEVWFYIAWVPQGKYPNRLIDYPVVKTRIIPWMVYALGATGYLHWGYNFWTKDLAEMGLAPGDNWIVYPGTDGPRSCLRWEAFRDGLEDYELFRMLAAKAPEIAQTLMREAVRGATDYVTDPAALENVRRKVIRTLEK